jgi:F0F1-type ATP synthase assembly protein I
VANQEEDYSGSTPILLIKLLVIGEKGAGFLMMRRKGVAIVFFFFFFSFLM